MELLSDVAYFVLTTLSGNARKPSLSFFIIVYHFSRHLKAEGPVPRRCAGDHHLRLPTSSSL